MRALARLAMVSVAVEKIGGLFFHPIGRTSGNATSGSSCRADGNTTPNFWDVVDVEGNAVKAIADVELDEVDWAEGWVSNENFL